MKHMVKYLVMGPVSVIWITRLMAKINSTYGTDAITTCTNNMHALLQISNTCRHHALVGRLTILSTALIAIRHARMFS